MDRRANGERSLLNPATLLDLLTRPEFLSGLGWGIVGALALLALSRRWLPAPFLGTAISAAALMPYLGVEDFAPTFPIGLIALMVGGELFGRYRKTAVVLLASGTAALVLDPVFPDELWVIVGSAIFIGVGGWALGEVEDALGHTGVSALMMGGSVFGIWAAVPDTEFASILVGATAATVFTAWPRTRAEIGGGGGYGLAAVMMVAIAMGGVGRPGSVLGAWLVLGVIVIIPLVAYFVPTAQLRAGLLRRRWVVFGIHGATVVVVARLAAHQDSVAFATAFGVPALILAAVAIAYIVTEPDPRSSSLSARHSAK